MAIAPTVLEGPMLKVARANTHIRELKFLTEPLSPNLYQIVSTFAQTGGPPDHPQCAQVIYQPMCPIPELLAVIVGDAIHDLRSALDRLAGGIVRTLPGKPLGDTRPYFPMSPEREKLESDKTLAAMEQALPGARNLLIEQLRPPNGPDEATWRFNVLNNIDKHNLIIPAVTIVEIQNLNATWGEGNVMQGGVDLGDAARPRVLMETGEPITIGENIRTLVDVRFGVGTDPFVGKPVVATLEQIRNLVLKVLQTFRDAMALQIPGADG